MAFYPSRHDHDEALIACRGLTPGLRRELDAEVRTVNQVAGAYACNERAWISRSEFDAALARLRSSRVRD